jgi:CheY-like chemotaxis protein
MGSEHAVPTILIIDDEPTIIDVVAEVLTDEGYETLTARGGQAALALLAQQRPDLMLLDLFMPEMSGLDLLARLEADESLATIPVVMMTAGALGNVDLSRGRPTQVIRKPFDMDDLIATVRTMV